MREGDWSRAQLYANRIKRLTLLARDNIDLAQFMLGFTLHPPPGGMILPNLQAVNSTAEFFQENDSSILSTLFAVMHSGLTSFSIHCPTSTTLIPLLAYMQSSCAKTQEFRISGAPLDPSSMLAKFHHLRVLSLFKSRNQTTVHLPVTVYALQSLGSLPCLDTWESDLAFEVPLASPSPGSESHAPFFPALRTLKLSNIVDICAFSDFLRRISSLDLCDITCHYSLTENGKNDVKEFVSALSFHHSLQRLVLKCSAKPSQISLFDLHGLCNLNNLRDVELSNIVSPETLTNDKLQPLLWAWRQLRTFTYRCTNYDHTRSRLNIISLVNLSTKCPLLSSLSLPMNLNYPFSSVYPAHIQPERRTAPIKLIITPSRTITRDDASHILLAMFLTNMWPNVSLELGALSRFYPTENIDQLRDVNPAIAAMARVRGEERRRTIDEVNRLLDMFNW